MNKTADRHSTGGHSQLAAEVEGLAEEIKLQALNLAVMVARVQNRNADFKGMEDQFRQLISHINESSSGIADIVEAFRANKILSQSLPTMTEVVEKQDIYDKIEVSLHHIYALSQQIIRSITKIRP